MLELKYFLSNSFFSSQYKSNNLPATVSSVLVKKFNPKILMKNKNSTEVSERTPQSNVLQNISGNWLCH